jgi:hypothetical protein
MVGIPQYLFEFIFDGNPFLALRIDYEGVW